MAEDKRDYSDYEIRRAADHEAQTRLAATCTMLLYAQCRLRLCHRNRHCSGAMVPSRHQALAIRTQREIGLSGRACATLPICIADHSSDAFIESLRNYMGMLAKNRTDNNLTMDDMRHLAGEKLLEDRSKPPAKRVDQSNFDGRKPQSPA